MAVTSSDLILYGAANMPENDTSAVGGAIDRTVKILSTDMSDIGGQDTLNVVSDDAADNSQVVVVVGRDGSGALVSETFFLNGTTPDSGSQVFARVLKIVVNATYAGTITVSENSGSQALATLEGSDDAPGGSAVLEVRRPFYAATANATGGADKYLYEKIFVANTNSSGALNSPYIELTNDGTSSNLIDFDLEGSVNDNNSGSNRLTEPNGGDMLGSPTWNDSAKLTPGGVLGARSSGTSDHVGVWLRMYLPDGESPENTNITLNVSGNVA